RFALSYDALKINGKFSERTTPLMISAMRSACSSLSITHGPAIRNRSPEPTRTVSIWKDRGNCLSPSHFLRPQKHLHLGHFFLLSLLLSVFVRRARKRLE